MDPVTQGIVGALASQALIRKPNRRRLFIAGICGLVGGMAADLDVLIRSRSDFLVMMEFHRHFTHALSFVPIGGLLAAFFVWLFVSRWVRFRQLLLYTTIGYATHGLIDSLTSYGTSLYWPFSQQRVSWDFISVIDPLFSLPLLVLLGASILKPTRLLVATAFFWVFLYLTFSHLQHQRALEEIERFTSTVGIKAERVRAMPTLFNNLLWRAIWESDGQVQVAEVKVPWFGQACLAYQGSRPLISLDILDTRHWKQVQWHDFERFQHFTQNWMVMLPSSLSDWGDIRYAHTAGSLEPLWGMRLRQGNQHAIKLKSPFGFKSAMTEHLNAVFGVLLYGCHQ